MSHIRKISAKFENTSNIASLNTTTRTVIEKKDCKEQKWFSYAVIKLYSDKKALGVST